MIALIGLEIKSAKIDSKYIHTEDLIANAVVYKPRRPKLFQNG